MQKSKNKVFITVVGITFLVMGYLFFAFWHPKPSDQYIAERDIRMIEQMLFLYKEIHGIYPESFDEIDKEVIGDRTQDAFEDPWGYSYQYSKTADGYKLYSIGLQKLSKEINITKVSS